MYLSVTLTLSSLTRFVLFTLHMQLFKSPEDPASCMFLPGLVKCRLVCLQASSPPNSRPFIGGGGLEIKTAQPVIIADCVFEGNSGRQGSGLHLDACPSTLVWNSSFDSNHATYEGGAVALVNSDGQGLLLGNSSLTHNFGKATDSLDSILP